MGKVPLTSNNTVVSSLEEAQARFIQPHNTDQITCFLRIGRPGQRDTRQRLQSVGSTLSAHTIHPSQSSDALGGLRAVRIGSIDESCLAAMATRNTTINFLEDTGRKPSQSTVASKTPPSVGSFKIERAQRASVSVRKISVGGSEDLVPVSLVHHQPLGPTSPHDLDSRFAKPLLAGFRSPSKIDFTQPFGNVNHPPSASASHPSVGRNNLLPNDKRKSIEPALPSSRLCSPADPLPQPNSTSLGQVNPISHSPSVSPKTHLKREPKLVGTDFGHTRSASTGHKRTSSVKK